MRPSNFSRGGVIVLMGAFSIVLLEMYRQSATRTSRLFGLFELQAPDFTLYGGDRLPAPHPTCNLADNL